MKILALISTILLASNVFAFEINLFGLSFSIGNPCKYGTSISSRQNGKVTVCGGSSSGSAIQEIQIENGSMFGTTRVHTFLATGSAARIISETRQKEAEEKLKKEIDKFAETAGKDVYPIVYLNDSNTKLTIIGTAFNYFGATLTALHTVSDLTPATRLHIFDTKSNSLREITGFAPIKREANNQINYYDDFCVLELDRNSVSFSPTNNPERLTKNFGYIQFGYPIGANSYHQPTINSSHSSHPNTAREGLIILNRSGQNILSSGGPVFDVISPNKPIAMSICIDEAGLVRSLNLSQLNAKIYSAIQAGFISDLSRIQYDYPFASECTLIGGRRGGGNLQSEEIEILNGKRK